MNYNNEFLCIDTASKAYLLGLLCADGCISGRTISLFLTEEDGYLLKSLQEEFKFFNCRYVKRYNQNNKPGCILSVNNQILKQQLITNGLQTRKSYDNKELLSVPSMDISLYSSFVRGFFDGDGSVFTNKARPNGIIVEICSVSYQFISQLKNILKYFDISTKIYNKQPNNKDRKQVIYRLYITKSSEIIKFREFIYSDNTNFYLSRKKERLNKASLLHDSRKKNVLKLNRNITCPYCTSKECTIKGIRQMNWGKAQRFKCKSCNKTHTVPYQETIARFPHKRKDEGMKPMNES